MHIHSCVELGSVAFDLFLWRGERRTVFLCLKEKKNMAHMQHSKFATENQFIWEGSQTKNRETPNKSVGINCPDFEGTQEDSRDPNYYYLFCCLVFI